MPFSGISVVLNGNTYNDASFLSDGHQTNFLAALSDWLEDAAKALLTTSASSVAVGTGTKTFTLAADRPFGTGGYVTITDNANVANWMFGRVTSYTPSTKVMVVDVMVSNGSGTITDWTVQISGPRGATGAAGTNGTNGTNGADGAGFTRPFMVSTGSSNAYVLTPADPLLSYQDGQVFIFEANHANTGAATANISGLGAVDIRKNYDQPLAANDLKANFTAMVRYESSNNTLQLVSSLAQILTNPQIRAWNRQIVSRGVVAATSTDQIAIVFDTTTRLHNIKHKLYAGTCTITLKKNGTAINFGVSPSTSVSVSTSQTTVAVNHSSLSYIDFAPGDRLDISITSPSSAEYLSVGLDTTENYS